LYLIKQQAVTTKVGISCSTTSLQLAAALRHCN